MTSQYVRLHGPPNLGVYNFGMTTLVWFNYTLQC